MFTWRQSQADFVAFSNKQGRGYAADRVILVIALVGVTNTILLGTMERTREIGTMKAMGMREGEIVRLFLLEATGIARAGHCGGLVAWDIRELVHGDRGHELDTSSATWTGGSPSMPSFTACGIRRCTLGGRHRADHLLARRLFARASGSRGLTLRRP